MEAVVLTPIEVEYLAVRRYLSQPRVYRLEGGLYEAGTFGGKYHTYKIFIRQTGSKVADIALAAEKAVQHFRPSLLLLVGVAGGVKDVAHGDIVVGTKAYGYESGKETEAGFAARPEVFPFDRELVDHARVVARSEEWLSSSPDPLPQVFFGPIASGDKVIASTTSAIYQVLQRHYNDTLALEMESIGFAKALSSHPSVRSMNIRGISDLLGDKAAADAGGGQERAAANAAAFAFECLRQFDFSKLKLYAVDVKELTHQLMPIVLDRLRTEISPASTAQPLPALKKVWTKLQPLFAEELEELRENPRDQSLLEEVEVILRSKLRRSFKKNEALQREMTALLQEAKAQAAASGKNVVSGNKISAGGDVHIGDKTNHNEVRDSGIVSLGGEIKIEGKHVAGRDQNINKK